MYKLIKHKVYGLDGTEYSIPKGLEIGGREIIFPCSIKTHADRKTPAIVEINNLIIVCFFPWDDVEEENAKKQGVDLNRNIWAFDKHGTKVWEIMEATFIEENRGHPYTGIWIKFQAEIIKSWHTVTHDIWAQIKDGSVIASNWQGHEYLVDIKTGKVEVIKGVS